MDTLTQMGLSLPPAVTVPPRKIWRVPIHGKELMAAGWKAGISADDAWEKIIKPILIKKGLPEGFTLDRTPVRMSPHGRAGVMLEFV